MAICITLNAYSQNIPITPSFRSNSPQPNPTDSIFTTWTGKPDGYSVFYTGKYIRSSFAKKDSVLNINKNLYDVPVKATARVNLGIAEPFKETIYFIYDSLGYNNRQKLTFKPTSIQWVSLNGQNLVPDIDYSIQGDSLYIEKPVVVQGLGYETIVQYAAIPPPDTAVVAIIFDDATLTDANVVATLDSAGLKAGFAIVTNGNQSFYPYLSRKAFYLAAQNSGYEILSHSNNHSHYIGVTTPLISTVSAARATFEGSYQQLLNDGMHVTGWVTPYNVMNPLFIQELGKIYRYAYTDTVSATASPTLVFRYGDDPLQMARMSMEAPSLATMTAQVDLAIAAKGMVTFYAHGYPDILTTSKFHDFIDYIKTKRDAGQLLIMTPGQAFKRTFGLRK